MKTCIVLALFVAAAMAAPQASRNDKDAVVVKSELENIGVGDYSHQQETSNGISSQAQGQLKSSPDGDYVVVRGQYSYTGSDGVVYTVTYVADENGFQPQGAHLPVPPQ